MDITVSRGRSSDRAKGGAHSWPSLIVPKLPSRDNSGDDGHVAYGTESGIPKFPHFKIFRWRLCIWLSSPCLTLLFKTTVSQNDLPGLDSLVQIKNRDTSRVRTVVTPKEQNGTNPPGAFEGTSTPTITTTTSEAGNFLLFLWWFPFSKF